MALINKNALIEKEVLNDDTKFFIFDANSKQKNAGNETITWANIKEEIDSEISEFDVEVTFNAGADMNGTKLTLDADADTSITADTDDQIDIEISGADDFRFTANTFTALSGSTIATNTIAETTVASGVTIDGALIKDAAFDTNVAAAGVTLSGTTLAADGTDAAIDITITPKGTGDVVISTSVAIPDGSVGDLAVKIGADENNGIYGVSDTQLGFAVEGVLVGGANTTGLFTDIISEQTGATGVTIDGVLLIDGGVYATTELETGAGGVSSSTNAGLASFYNAAVQNNIAAATGGAIGLTNYYTTINTDAGGDAFTLADGTVKGQMKKIHLIVDGGGDATIAATFSSGTTLTMADAGDFAILVWGGVGTSWFAIELGNSVDGITAPVIS